ncbi:hypothetical protein [Vibrio sp. SCSIO 43136]|uniref:hypothetical protein n=1 Tax=Vibrio sp. SCSIO 43136 TaxID=2819101 RepID=UPI0020751354|nr:hypothetical protein [Vibrio sp. SCSIO 43136]USD64908.1 hypothetical protein J4N39_12620 [Vibrio sp. SCSIO 43136]
MGIDKSLAHLSASDRTSSNKAKSQPSEPALPIIEQSNEPYEETISDWCNHVFGSFLSIYETMWEHQYGSMPSGKFVTFAQSIDDNGLNRVLKHCHERIQLGNAWPPQMGELWVLRDSLTAEELLDSRLRVMTSKPANRVEKWLVQNKTFDLKQLPEYRLDERFKKYYLEAQRLEERGLLKTEASELMLPRESVKNLNDIKRDEYEHKHGAGLHPRIEAILKGRKE